MKRVVLVSLVFSLLLVGCSNQDGQQNIKRNVDSNRERLLNLAIEKNKQKEEEKIKEIEKAKEIKKVQENKKVKEIEKGQENQKAKEIDRIKEENRIKKMSKKEIFDELNKINKQLENKNIGEEKIKEIEKKISLLEQINNK